MPGEYIILEYIRLSVDEAKSDSLSIENQLLLLDDTIARMSIPNVKIRRFIDNGHSGTNFERPGVQALLDIVQSGGASCVIVKDFSRFGRNAIEMGYFIEQVFPLCRVRFISVDDQYDSDQHEGDTGGLDVAFKFLIHEQYSRDISRKITASKHERMRRGEHILAFYGYRKVDGKLEIDEPAADTVRRIYALALEGKNLLAIAEVLYAEKRKTPSAYKTGEDICLWGKSHLLKVLREEQYTGTYVAGKTRTLEVGSNKRIKVDKANWVRIANHHPAIIDREIFDTVQSILDQKSQPLRGRKISTNKRYANLRISPLRGKAVCGICNHVLRLSKTKNAAFHCNHTLAAPDAACHKLRIPAKELERNVLSQLRKQAGSVSDGNTDIRLPISEHEVKMLELENDKRSLYERYVEGGISAEHFKTANVKLTRDIEDLRHAHDAMTAQAGKQSAALATVTAIRQAAEALKGKRTLTAEIVSSLIDKVRVYPGGKVTIDWTVPGLNRNTAAR